MNKEIFYRDDALPFFECRYSQNSGKHYKSHIHSTLSIGAIDNSSVCYQVAGENALLTSGSLAIVNPNTIHQCNPIEQCTRSYHMLYIDIAWCFKIQKALFNTKIFIPCQQILLDDYDLYYQYLQTMSILMNSSFLLEKEQHLIDLIGKIFIKSISQNVTTDNNMSVQVLQLKQQLESHLAQDITLNAIANDLSVNPFTLLRQFKRQVGITPHAYRMNHRIERAKQLLQQGEELSDVSLSCGFFDQSHLNRHFKAITAVTPKEYQVNFIQ